MKLRVINIPADGLDVDVDLTAARLTQRAAAAAERNADAGAVAALSPVFLGTPKARLNLNKEGLTVVVKGKAGAEFKTICARCNEDALDSVSVEILLVLKPFDPNSPIETQVEDLNLGFYNGQDIDCSEIVEEYLLLHLPISSLCRPDCKGLCVSCGTNLNQSNCSCHRESEGDERFAALRQLKLQ